MVKMLDADFDDVAEAIGRFVYKNKDAGGTPGSAACWKPVAEDLGVDESKLRAAFAADWPLAYRTALEWFKNDPEHFAKKNPKVRSVGVFGSLFSFIGGLFSSSKTAGTTSSGAKGGATAAQAAAASPPQSPIVLSPPARRTRSAMKKRKASARTSVSKKRKPSTSRSRRSSSRPKRKRSRVLARLE